MGEDKRIVALATLTAGVVVAQQTAGKATRDALFLLAHDIGDLPRMMVMAAVACIVGVPLLSRYTVVLGPRGTVPALFFLSAVGFVLEFLLGGFAPKTAASMLYLHQSVFGPILVSGFWSLITERLDVRAMRKAAPRIATGATAGGLAGGVFAERLSLVVEPASLLPVLAVLHGLCLLLVLPLRGARQRRDVADDLGTAEVLRDNLYLRHIGLLLLMVTIGTGFIDFAFKQAASEAFDGQALVRFFAVFYTATSAVTLVTQALVARYWPRSLGPAETVSSLPLALGVGAAVVAVMSGVVARTLAAGFARVVQSSVFRTGYETLYTPVHVQDRRAAKTANDVWFDRLGDLIAGLLIQAVHAVRSRQLLQVVPEGVWLAAMAAAASAGALWLVWRLRREYVESLADQVVDVAMGVGLGGGPGEHLTPHLAAHGGHAASDPLTEATLTTRFDVSGDGLGAQATMMAIATAPALDVEPARAGTRSDARAPGGDVASVVPDGSRDDDLALDEGVPHDPLLDRIDALRSREVRRVRAALAYPVGPSEAPHVIRLLSRDDVYVDAIEALRPHAKLLLGQLLDALMDQGRPARLRRRIPRIVVGVDSERTVVGLCEGLRDPVASVRLQCAQALVRVDRARRRATSTVGSTPSSSRGAEVAHDGSLGERARQSVLDAIAVALDELEAARGGHDRAALDTSGPPASSFGDPSGDPSDLPPLREVVELELVFVLLSLLLEGDAVWSAYAGVCAGAGKARATALEYLEHAVPGSIAPALCRTLKSL